MIKFIPIALSLLLVTACGGGGSAATPPPADPGVSLAKLQSITEGEIYATSLTGSDSNRNSLTGTFAVVNRPQAMMGGSTLVTPQDYTLTVTVPGPFGGDVTTTDTGYFLDDGSLVSFSEVDCLLVMPVTMPASVKVGDTGLIDPITCGSKVLASNWEVQDAGNGDIRVIETRTNTNASTSVLFSTTVITFTLNSAGDILSFNYVSIIFPNDPLKKYTQTFSSSI